MIAKKLSQVYFKQNNGVLRTSPLTILCLVSCLVWTALSTSMGNKEQTRTRSLKIYTNLGFQFSLSDDLSFQEPNCISATIRSHILTFCKETYVGFLGIFSNLLLSWNTDALNNAYTTCFLFIFTGGFLLWQIHWQGNICYKIMSSI